MIEIVFTFTLPKENEIAQKLHAALVEKLEYFTKQLHLKVMENVSGKVLKKKSGDLARSIKMDMTIGTVDMIGSVFVDPETPKALALEYGQKEEKTYFAKNARVMHFFKENGESVFTKYVTHKAKPGYRYLGLAAEEMEPLIIIGFNEVVAQVLGP